MTVVSNYLESPAGSNVRQTGTDQDEAPFLSHQPRCLLSATQSSLSCCGRCELVTHEQSAAHCLLQTLSAIKKTNQITSNKFNISADYMLDSNKL